MALDASIYSNQLARPRSAQDYTQEYLQTAAAGQNMLAARMQMQEAQDQRAQQNALAQLMAGGFDRKAPDAVQRLYQTAPRLAPGVVKGFAEQDKAEADVGKTKADTERIRVETQNKAMEQYRSMLAGVRDPQTAAQWVQAGYSDPVLGPVLSQYAQPQEAVRRIPQDPAEFQQWLQKQAVGAAKFVELNKPQTTVRNTGGTTDVIQTPGLGGPATVVSSVKNTQSPDSVASNARMATDAAANRAQAERHFNAKQAEDNQDTLFTPEAIVNAAARYNIDGTLPPMGMGKAGAAGRAAILNKAAILAAERGDTPEAQRIAQIANKATAAAMAQLQKQQSMVSAFEKNFNKNADIALEYSAKVDRTGTPILNKWINAGKRSVAGDADLAAFDQAIKSVSNEYAKIISGSMGNTATAEGEIKKIEGMLNTAQTPEQVKAVITLMKRETQNRMAGFDEEQAHLRESMIQPKKRDQGSSPQGEQPAAASNKPPLDSFGGQRPPLSAFGGK